MQRWHLEVKRNWQGDRAVTTQPLMVALQLSWGSLCWGRRGRAPPQETGEDNGLAQKDTSWLNLEENAAKDFGSLDPREVREP